MPLQNKISFPVVRRLPRYYRYLGELIQSGITKVSSSELAHLMGSTASQVRQDFNCFGEFGQQGIGYNTENLYRELGELLFQNQELTAVLIGAGSLGHTVAKYIATETQGMRLVAAFDADPELIGGNVGDLPVLSIGELEAFCQENHPRVGVICIPRNAARELAKRLSLLGLDGIWNFSHFDFALIDHDLIVENVHLGDSMMSLEFLINNKSEANYHG